MTTYFLNQQMKNPCLRPTHGLVPRGSGKARQFQVRCLGAEGTLRAPQAGRTVRLARRQPHLPPVATATPRASPAAPLPRSGRVPPLPAEAPPRREPGARCSQRPAAASPTARRSEVTDWAGVRGAEGRREDGGRGRILAPPPPLLEPAQMRRLGWGQRCLGTRAGETLAVEPGPALCRRLG